MNPTEAYYRNYKKYLAHLEAEKAKDNKSSISKEETCEEFGKDNPGYDKEEIELRVTSLDSISNNITVF